MTKFFEEVETPKQVIEEEVKGKTVSYSQYSLWATCPLTWKLQYIDKIKGEPGIELVFGTAMHDTIQHWLKILYNEAPVRARTFDLNEYLKEQLSAGVKERLFIDGKKLTTQAEVAEYYADGCNILEHVRKYAKDYFPKSHELKGVEVPLKVAVAPGLTFRGYLDVVLYHKATKTLHIYDFKTSRYGWTYQKKDFKKLDQILLYKRFYAEVFGIPETNIKIQFIILKRKVNESPNYPVKHIVGFEPANGTTSMKNANARFQKFLEIFDEHGEVKLDMIKPTPSESNCKYCPFKNDASKCSASYYLSNKDRKVTKK